MCVRCPLAPRKRPRTRWWASHHQLLPQARSDLTPKPEETVSHSQHSATSMRCEMSRANCCPAEAGVLNGSASAAVDQLSNPLAGETGEPSEEAVGGSCSVCGPQRRSQPAPGSLELGLGSADSVEGFRNGGGTPLTEMRFLRVLELI